MILEVFSNLNDSMIEAISSCPIANFLGEETNICLTTTSFQVVVIRSPLSLLFFRLNRPSCLSRDDLCVNK